MNRRRWIVLSIVVVAAAAMTAGLLDWRRRITPPDPDPAVVAVTPQVRVLLDRDVSAFEVSIDGPSTVIDENGETIVAYGKPIKQLKGIARKDGNGGTVLELGSLSVSNPIVDIRPTVPARFHLNVKDSKGSTLRREYRGSLRCLLNDDGTVKLINVVDVESYLKGVLGVEMLAHFPLECYRAQAVAARTFALYQRMTVGRRRAWDVTTTPATQAYMGIDGERRSRFAVLGVDSTRGVVCATPTPEGEGLLCTFYCSICGGRTWGVEHMSNLENAGPLAGGVECPHCRSAPGKFYRWGPLIRTKRDIAQSLGRRYDRIKALGPIDRVEVALEDDFGRPIDVRIVGRDGRSETLKSEFFRLSLDLASPDFQMEDRGGEIAFTNGRGLGHCAGLCQYGAAGFADAGESAAAILRRYYPGVELIRAY